MRTQNQCIVVSGGSRGLGLHLVEGFLKGGNRIATFARSETDAVCRLAAEHPDSFYFEVLDARDHTGIQTFVDSVGQRYGAIDALINNAAIAQDGLLVHSSPEHIGEVISINLIAPILLTRAVTKRMLLQPRRGSVLTISSISGARGYAGLSVYAASKGGMEAFTRAMARELGESGITFNCIAPGFFYSPMTSVLLPEHMETIRKRTPTGRLSDEDNVLAAADLLLSRETNIHGQVITIDGGISN